MKMNRLPAQKNKPNSKPISSKAKIKLTAFSGTFLTTLPIFVIITNSYTIKFTWKCGVIFPAGESIFQKAL